MLNLDQELQNFIDQHLPAVQRLEFRIEAASAERVILSAPLEANINDKKTAFGGSQQMLALTCAWSLVYLNMIDAGLKHQQFVVAEVNTKYRKPVNSSRFYAVSVRDDALSDFTNTAREGTPSRATNGAYVFDASDATPLMEKSDIAGDLKTAATILEARFATTK